MREAHKERSPVNTEDSDQRFTTGLLVDVATVLKQHGYTRDATPEAAANSLVKLLELVLAFEGKAP